MRRALPIAIGLLALSALGIVVDRGLDLGPFQGSPAGIEMRYWDGASKVRSEGWKPAAGEASSDAGYFLLLAPVTGDEPGTVRRARRIHALGVVSALALVAAFLVYVHAGPWPAVVTAVAVAGTAPIVLAGVTFGPGPVAVVLALVALLVLGRSPGGVSWLLAGVFLGLSARFHLLIGSTLGAVLLGWMLLRPQAAGRRLGPLALVGGWAASLVGTGLLLSTQPLLPPLHGIEVYRGHRAEASGVSPRRGDKDAERWWAPVDYLREASRAQRRQVSPGEGDVFWGRRALTEAVTHPGAELRRTAVKALAIFQGDPIPRVASTPFLLQGAETPWVLRALVWTARVLIPLGWVGLILARRAGSGRLLAAALAGFITAWITYADADAQLLASVAALAGVGFLARHLVQTRGRSLATFAFALGAVLVFGLLPAWGVVPGQGLMGEDHFQLGALFDRDGRGSAALREYERALRLEPENPYPRLAIAVTLARDGVNEEAIAELERLRESHLDFIPGLLGLTRLYQAEKRYVEAAAVYADLLKLEPWNAEHWNNLGTMYVQVGDFAQATKALESALALDPEYVVARENLDSLRERGLAPGAPPGANALRVAQEEILAHIRAGDWAKGDSALAAAYARFGANAPELEFLDGTMRLSRGDAAGAIPLLESARRGLGATLPVLSNLGTAYARAGRFAEAKQHFDEALRLQPTNFQVQKSLQRVQAALDSIARRPER